MRAHRAIAVFATLVVTASLLTLPAAAQRGKAKGKQQNGPAFCRSGAGHPVYGRQWCLDHGFGLGNASWRKAQPGRIRFERVPQGRIETTRLGWREVAGILTDVALDEIFGESHYDLDRERLAGEWRGGDTEGLLVFELMLGDDPVAELTDLDLDGQVDVVLVAEH
jgi:hypothetical protein